MLKSRRSKRPKIGKNMLLNRSEFIKKQEVSRLLTQLGIRTPLVQVTSLGDIFKCKSRNNIISKVLLAEGKLMPEMHLRQLRYIALVGHSQKSTQEQESSKKQGVLGGYIYIYKNELDKACFQHDMTCVDFNDLP